MFYSYVELADGTQIAYSDVLDDGVVEVSVERPVELDFDSARCLLPAFEWSDVRGFSESDMAYLDAFVHNNAQLIMRLAREASRSYALAVPLPGARHLLLDGGERRARARARREGAPLA